MSEAPLDLAFGLVRADEIDAAYKLEINGLSLLLSYHGISALKLPKTRLPAG